jgi:autotransporter passenger strand-loop-strand repeat protein
LGGGEAIDTTINSGGYEVLFGDGVSIGTTVNDGGTEWVRGGTADKTS